MSISYRRILDLFLWFQTISLLTEAFQHGLIDQIVMAINTISIFLFLAYLKNSFGRAGVSITVLCILLIAQLLVPASLSLIFAKSGVLFGELIKLTAWIVLFLFSVSFHSERSRVLATIKTIRRCAFLLLGAVVAFQVTNFGETAYGLGVFYLGGIKNEPSVSMYSLALLSVFLMQMPRRAQYTGILGLFFVIMFLMKRSSIISGLLLILIGLKYIVPSGRMFRVTIFFLVSLIVIMVAVNFEFGQFLGSTDLISSRFRDLEKIQEYSDIGYLGSGRLGLLIDHFNAFQLRSAEQQLFGLTIQAGQGGDNGGYLGQGLHAAAHNDLMEILTRGGIFGLITYVTFLVAIGAKLTLFAGRTSDPFLRSVLFSGKMAGLAYLLHITIGVIFKVQFMVIIAIIVGIALRTSSDSRLEKNTAV